MTEASGNSLARTTYTLAYDSIGRATQVQVAKGQVFLTDYDNDGLVNSVTRTDTNPDIPVVTYTYGGSGLTNGMVTQVVDNLQSMTQDISYQSTGGGKGQVSESGLNKNYSVTYSYDDAGNRSVVSYDTPDSDSSWKYSDYISLGDPAGSAQVFQTLTKLDTSGNPTAEAFHYQYDTSGRITNATFAMTPEANFTPTTGNPHYDSTHKAWTRARAWYSYDPGGRTLSVEHYWDTWGSSSYSSSQFISTASNYEKSTSGANLNRGIKTSDVFYEPTPGSPSTYRTRTAYYGYDAQRDFLVSADYSDAIANETPTWAYDSNGNRTSQSCSYDALNQQLTCNAFDYTHDAVGNRTTRYNRSNSATAGWALQCGSVNNKVIKGSRQSP